MAGSSTTYFEVGVCVCASVAAGTVAVVEEVE